MTLREIFDTMDYGPAPENDTQARAWIAKHGGEFGHFIDGDFTQSGETFATKNPATGEILAQITQGSAADIDAAVAAANAAFALWSGLSCHARAKYLYALARLLQKHARLFAVLETLDNGKPIRESRDIDIPLAQRHFYYHAGLAQLRDDECAGHVPVGVCGQIIPWNFPLLMLAWKIAPALAAGNTVVLKPAEYTSLSALLFADICREAGLPKGVVNIVTGDGETGQTIIAHPDIAKIAFTGSTQVGQYIRQITAGTGKSLTLELGGKSPYIVFDDADIDSAIEGLVDAIWFNQGQVCCAGSRLLVAESIADMFHAKLKTRMGKLRIGDPLDKSIDIGAMVDPAHYRRVLDMVDANDEGETYHAPIAMPETGCFYPPTLITGLSPSARLMQDEIFGPVLVSTTFRTPQEAVELANNTRYGLAATIWSENINLALDIAAKVTAGVVWINATNLFDAAAPFGGIKESGYGREGGAEGLQAYLKPAQSLPDAPVVHAVAMPHTPIAAGLDRTAKLYIGGKQTRPDSGYCAPIWAADGRVLGHVGQGNRKDIRNAVEAAHAAAGWAKTTGHMRAQILYYIAENLSARAGEFALRLHHMTGDTTDTAQAEVEDSIQTLFTWAAWADKFGGDVKPVPLRGVALATRAPVGVIGVFAPHARPLAGAIGAMAPAIAMGNRVVLVPSAPFPLAATDLYQVLDTSDLPGGVVNIVTGMAGDLAPTLASHADIDAIWTFSPDVDQGEIEYLSAGNLKRCWSASGQLPDIGTAQAKIFLDHATEVKTIWLPYGA